MHSRSEARIYICRKPLMGTEAIAKLAPKFFYLHQSVAIETEEEIWMCDFHALAPKDPKTAVQIFALQEIPGEIRVKRIDALGKLRSYVGTTMREGIEKRVQQFNERWDTRLKLFVHDCGSYAQQLVDYLMDQREDNVHSELHNHIKDAL